MWMTNFTKKTVPFFHLTAVTWYLHGIYIVFTWYFFFLVFDMVHFSNRWYFQSISDFQILRLKIGGKSDKVDGKSGGNLKKKVWSFRMIRNNIFQLWGLEGWEEKTAKYKHEQLWHPFVKP